MHLSRMSGALPTAQVSIRPRAIRPHERLSASLPGRSCVRVDIPASRPMPRSLHIELDSLDSAERRDLANALLRAAWSATLEHTRLVLLDATVVADAAILDEATADPNA